MHLIACCDLLDLWIHHELHPQAPILGAILGILQHHFDDFLKAANLVIRESKKSTPNEIESQEYFNEFNITK